MARALRPLKVPGVAAIARSGHGVVVTERSALVTRVAIHGGVRTDQREPHGVPFDLLDRYSPAANCVTGFAVGSQLAFVDVSMAGGAFRSYIGKYRLGMAEGAVNIHVHSAQRKLGLIMIKFRNGADRLPSNGGMAVLAG